jgi:molybdopterin synthase sulfur carrier subunit
MQIEILLFGYMTEIVGKSRITLQNIPSTDQLKLQLHRLYPKLKDTPYLIAIDKNIVTENVVLKDNHIIALLPPYAGG